MSNAIRCPECGSTNVECVEKPHHNHICHNCGHSLLRAARERGRRAAVLPSDTADPTPPPETP